MSSFANSVQIGPEFFKKSLRDYSDHFWAFAREILQNSLDCGSSEIHVRIAEDAAAGTTTVVVRNNGEPMTMKILTDKLLALGGSGKDFRAGAVGGFGKAKEVLYFAHQKYKIESGSWIVEGSGAGYNLNQAPTFLSGTRSVITWDGLVAEKLLRQFRRFMWMADRKCQMHLEEELIESRFKGARFNRTLVHEGVEWADVKVHTAEAGLIVVRIGGTPMFVNSSGYGKTVIVELRGTSVERLTSNRDGVKYPWANSLHEFTEALTVDRKSALREQKPVYHRHAGRKLRIKIEPVTQTSTWVAPVVAALVDSRAEPVANPNRGAGTRQDIQGRHERPESVLDMQFIVKNCMAKPVPAEYDPQSLEFSDYAHWVVRAWAGCLLELHEIFGVQEPFSIGFIFSPDLYGECEDDQYGRVYFVNPLVFGPRSHRRRFKKSDKGELVAAAAHEFVHGGLGFSYHNEDYASGLTKVMAAVLKGWRKFSWLAK